MPRKRTAKTQGIDENEVSDVSVSVDESMLGDQASDASPSKRSRRSTDASSVLEEDDEDALVEMEEDKDEEDEQEDEGEPEDEDDVDDGENTSTSASNSKKKTKAAPASKKSSSKKSATKKLTAAQSSDLVKEYMLAQNRPFNATALVLNLKKQVGVASLKKILAALTQEGVLSEKVLGKQQFYYPNQDQFETSTKASLAQLDKDVSALREQVNTEKEVVSKLSSHCRSLSGSLSNDALAAELARLRTENETMRAKLAELTKTSCVVSEAERAQMNKRLAFALSKWKERKRLTMQIADTLMDSAAERIKMKRPELLEEAGVETDEEMGVTMPSV